MYNRSISLALSFQMFLSPLVFAQQKTLQYREDIKSYATIDDVRADASSNTEILTNKFTDRGWQFMDRDKKSIKPVDFLKTIKSYIAEKDKPIAFHVTSATIPSMKSPLEVRVEFHRDITKISQFAYDLQITHPANAKVTASRTFWMDLDSDKAESNLTRNEATLNSMADEIERKAKKHHVALGKESTKGMLASLSNFLIPIAQAGPDESIHQLLDMVSMIAGMAALWAVYDIYEAFDQRTAKGFNKALKPIALKLGVGLGILLICRAAKKYL